MELVVESGEQDASSEFFITDITIPSKTMTFARPYPIATCILFSQTEMTCGLLNSEVWLPNFSKFKAFLDLALFLVSILKVALSPNGFFNWSHLQNNVPGVYRRSIFKIRPHILIGLQKLRLRPKD